ncbi:MAG: RbsD/FucU family protein [Devosiaceae bacterium]
MLKGIDPRLNADVLHALRGMGHSDTVVLTDTNFPAESVARYSVLGKLLRMDNISTTHAAQAILSVLPLDTMEPGFAGFMASDTPDTPPPVHQEMQSLVKASGYDEPMDPIDRFAFYDRAKGAYAVIQTGERRFYGCFIFRKGVIAPDG